MTCLQRIGWGYLLFCIAGCGSGKGQTVEITGAPRIELEPGFDGLGITFSDWKLLPPGSKSGQFTTDGWIVGQLRVTKNLSLRADSIPTTFYTKGGKALTGGSVHFPDVTKATDVVVDFNITPLSKDPSWQTIERIVVHKPNITKR